MQGFRCTLGPVLLMCCALSIGAEGSGSEDRSQRSTVAGGVGREAESLSPEAGTVQPSIDPAPVTPGDIFGETVRPLLQEYCFRCHSGVEPEADINLALLGSEDEASSNATTWRRVWSALREEQMPPDEPLPTDEERKRLIHSVTRLLDQAAREGGREPGHVVMRRLNQVEYNNTVLDLFGAYRPTHYSGGTQYDPQKGMSERVRVVAHRDPRRTVVPLPPDDLGYGFNNIGEVLSLPPFLMEKYLAASRQVIEQLVDGYGQRHQDRGKREPAQDPQEGARKFIAAFSRRAMDVPLAGHEIDRDPRGSARRFIAAFGHRAFRRPMTDEEIDRYLTLYEGSAERGEPFETALKIPLQAMLVSPYFLFRAEQGIEAEGPDGLRPLTDHELATRLSYFLWSSMPDEQLFRLADTGQLRAPDVLEAQARRMLMHRYSKELAEQFGMQWLELTGIRGAMPFPDRYPDFYKLKYLPEAMQMEALLLFETILVEDRSVLDFLDPGFTWLNGTLNGYYGIDSDRSDVRNEGMYWKRYRLPDKRRGGVLTMGGTMLATSLAARTSPVKRGKWVLENILGAPPPPPPDNVEELDATAAPAEDISLRERLERHRADSACAVCHRRMDPIGFGLENFDAIGKWRSTDGGKPIDAAGTLADGTSFEGPVELKQILATEHRAAFLRCLTEKMMTYALGRKLEYSDIPEVTKIVEQLEADEYRFSTLVVGIVRSEPFRYAKVARQNPKSLPDH